MQLRLYEQPYRAKDAIRHLYFPTAGVISIIVTMMDGASVEAGMIGNEGVLGLCVLFGAETGLFDAVVQEPVTAYRMNVADALAVFQRSAALQQQLQRYTDVLLTMVSQSAACNRLHDAEQRLGRWLLMTRRPRWHGRVQHDAGISWTHVGIAAHEPPSLPLASSRSPG